MLEHCNSTRADRKYRPKVVILSSSLLTDRMILYSNCLEKLSADCDVHVWATSATAKGSGPWEQSPVPVWTFPDVSPFREFPYNLARRLNEFAWDYRLRPPSRLSMRRHVRSKTETITMRSLALLGRVSARAGCHEVFEGLVEKLLLSYTRSSKARERLIRERPDCLVTTNPFWFDEPGVAAEARKLGIPILAMIPSWDNITTKSRMVFKYDGYLLWSEQAREELLHYYPDSWQRPISIVGASQFDVFFQERFSEPRAAFCERHGLRADRPFIVYAIGSPNFIRGEHYGALQLAERICAGDLGDVQMLVRPHPTKDNAEMAPLFSRFRPRVLVQTVAVPGTRITARTQTQMQVLDWISTFRHASVVVNLSSTVALDAAMFDKPVVNLDFDPAPEQHDQALIKDVNHLWSHFKPIAESGGLWLANDMDEVVRAVREYLAHPDLHRESRRRMAEYVCGYVDGKCGERMAQAIVDFVRQRPVPATAARQIQSLPTADSGSVMAATGELANR